jgi:hypothetical protein
MIPPRGSRFVPAARASPSLVHTQRVPAHGPSSAWSLHAPPLFPHAPLAPCFHVRHSPLLVRLLSRAPASRPVPTINEARGRDSKSWVAVSSRVLVTTQSRGWRSPLLLCSHVLTTTQVAGHGLLCSARASARRAACNAYDLPSHAVLVCLDAAQFLCPLCWSSASKAAADGLSWTGHYSAGSSDSCGLRARAVPSSTACPAAGWPLATRALSGYQHLGARHWSNIPHVILG